MKEQKHQNLGQNFKIYFMIMFKIEADVSNYSYMTISS